MKKNDIKFIIVVLSFALIFFLGNRFLSMDKDTYIKITVDGKTYGKYSLKDNQDIHINQTNILRIKDGTADMIHATCKDKLCVHQKSISHDRESIICLPNKVIVEVCNKKGSKKLDAVASCIPSNVKCIHFLEGERLHMLGFNLVPANK
ncbi:MAG: NusG domain II-containing protein [Lachnospiraceae bacterium]